MDDYLKEALEIVKAQASVRTMNEDEITSMVKKIAADLKCISSGCSLPESPGTDVAPEKSIKDRSIVCLECGKSFKILSSRHLASHGLDAKSYREKWGLKKGAALAAKALQRERRKKMKDMKLWERRGAAKGTANSTS
ncbi:MAG: MucR family transcriptional regulator [Desulfovibrio sp.]|jgi:predicted transcriptional regulator|nr:MucR family transcriptional regulator [Desulfovibrio sp.]